MEPWCNHHEEYICETCLKCGKCCQCKVPLPTLIHRNSKKAADRHRELLRLQSE